MARRIPYDVKTVSELAQVTDTELQRLERLSGQGKVSQNRLASSTDSYLYLDQGVLKFFNATTGESKTVTLE